MSKYNPKLNLNLGHLQQEALKREHRSFLNVPKLLSVNLANKELRYQNETCQQSQT